MNMSEAVASLPSSEAERTGGAGQVEESEGEGEVEVGGEEEDDGSANAAPRQLTQSSLIPYRAPVLPNLAQAAIQRLQKRNPGDNDSESSDFQPPKRRKVDDSEPLDEEKEGQTCSICFEPWSNSGHHRISSLKCGHLFGLNCIEKWIKGSGGGKCPQCNAPAKKTDIRVIYSKAISVVDTTDRDRALKDLEEEKRLRISAQKAEAQAIIQYQLARAECDRLKEEIRDLREQLERYDGPPPPGGGEGARDRGARDRGARGGDTREGQYVLVKTIKITDTGKARVMAHDPLQSMMVVSKPATSQLVHPFGVAKLSTVDLRHSEYVGIHGDVIRGVAFSPSGDGMLLTASMDKSIKLTSMHANSEVQSFQVPVPAWACSWDHDDPNYFCCGLQNGTIQFYDIRNTSSHVAQLVRPDGGACPITSLSYVPLCRASTLKGAGLLAGSLNGCVFWEKERQNDTTYKPHVLDTLSGGTCVCVSFESHTRHCLASFRPSRRFPNCRHELFQLHHGPSGHQTVSCQIVHQFQGGPLCRLLSRSKLLHHPEAEDKIVAAFGDEATKSVHLWDVSKAVKLQQLLLGDAALLDLTQFGSNSHLAVLTENKLFIYEWQRR